MLEIMKVLHVNRNVATMVYDYLTGGAWWAWAVDAGVILIGVLSVGTVAAIQAAGRLALRSVVSRLGRGKAIAH